MRVVSLVPSVTESLCAWGVIPVGVTRWCEHPELPAVGGTKDPDVAAIVALAPDLVVMCEEENRIEDAEALEKAGVRVHAMRVRSIVDLPSAMTALAAAVGASARWDPPPAAPARGPARLRAFVPIWREGKGAAYTTLSDDTYGSSVLAELGVTNVYGDAPERYPQTTLEVAVTRGADVVIAPSEPYPFGPRHESELARVAPVVFVDGQDLFWWGVRAASAQSRLADVLADVIGRVSP